MKSDAIRMVCCKFPGHSGPCELIPDPAQVDQQLLSDLRALRDHAVRSAAANLGASIELVVSGNGESWRVFCDGEPLHPLSKATPFEQALHEAAEHVRKKA